MTLRTRRVEIGVAVIFGIGITISSHLQAFTQLQRVQYLLKF